MSDAAFHPEDIARAAIDRQLAACGWVVQSRTEMNVGAGQGVAVREFQTASGPADYALFVDRRLCGVIEAKPEGTTLSGFSDQAERYMTSAPGYLVRDDGQVRFEYVASPTEILFRDHADPVPASRRVFAFHRPEALARWLREPETLRRRLQAMPPLIEENLRGCQVDAVRGVEGSLARNHPRALVQMATGAGKTFTAATLSYRLLAHAGFRRILFLADRANLVRQTRDEYLAYRPPGTGRSFAELYNVQKLGAAGLDPGAQVVVATIQRVYATLTGAALTEDDEEGSSFERGAGEAERVVAYNPAVPIESFDLVVTDECHRSIYGTWRQVLDYFDAFTLGVAARNRTVADAQSRAVFDADSLRRKGRPGARYLRLSARSVRRTRDRKSRRTIIETDRGEGIEEGGSREKRAVSWRLCAAGRRPRHSTRKPVAELIASLQGKLHLS